MIIKPNRGRDWLDWQRKLCWAGKWIGAGAVLLMMSTLLFGEMGISRYLHLRDHALPAVRGDEQQQAFEDCD